jgi:DNA-binding SARP family transcriptional activator
MCRVKKAGEILPPHRPFSSKTRVRRKDGSYCLIELTTVVLREEDSFANGFTLHIAQRLWEPSNGMRVHLLGPVMVERTDGSVVGSSGWKRTKVRALLAILALQRGLPVHRERLIEILWANLDYPAARQNLNSTVYDLRQSLATTNVEAGPECSVIYESNHYSLKWSSADWLDVDEFERLVQRAREAAAPAHSILQYRRAIDLYRDEFLSDVILVYADDYYLREQRRLRELYLDVLEELGKMEETLGRNEAAHELYARVLALDPCREHTGRRLMNIYLRAGDRTAALVLFQQLAETLKSEFGAAPDRDTYELFNMALRGH